MVDKKEAGAIIFGFKGLRGSASDIQSVTSHGVRIDVVNGDEPED